MASIISTHNNQILRSKTTSYGCNCRNKESCPLDNKCLTPRIIYEAEVTNNVDDERKLYIGLCETPFKERYRNYVKAFKHNKYSTDTELSKYVWKLKEKNVTRSIKWRVIKAVHTNAKSNFCKLCLMEKFYLINSLDDVKVLHQRSELISKCRHQNKLLIKSVSRNYSMD